MPYKATPIALNPAASGSSQSLLGPSPSGFASTFSTFLLSFWMKADAGFASIGLGFPPGSGGWGFSMSSSGIASGSHKANGTTIGRVQYNTPSGLLDTWTHFLFSVDTAAATQKLYVNGAPVAPFDNFWPLTDPMGIGVSDQLQFFAFHGSDTTEFCIADLYVGTPAAFFDPANPTNLAKFISGGNPVDLGAHGALPTGAQPLVFLGVPFGGTGPQFLANRGSAGNFTASEAIALCRSGPFPSSGVIRVLLPPAELQFCDADGHPFAGGTLEMYIVGTTTPKATWQDPDGLVLNTNPIVLDSAGRALIYGDGGYRTILRDADGNLIWDQPSFTYVSSAMAPVVGAATLADARHAMGIDDAIQVETDRALAAEAAEVIARNAAIAVETARAEAAEAAETAARIAADAVLQAEIDAVVTVPPFQAGSATTPAGGHLRVTYPVAFALGSTSAVVVTVIGAGFISNTASVNSDRFGFDIWMMHAGTPIGTDCSFNWFATQD